MRRMPPIRLLVRLLPCVLLLSSWIRPSRPLTASLKETGIDRDRDGFYEALVIETTVHHLKPHRRYDLHAHILLPEAGLEDCDGPHGMTLREYQAKVRGTVLEDTTKWFTTVDGTGTARFTHVFDGDELTDLRTDGPWTMEPGLLTVYPDGHVFELRIKTKPWSWRKFGERSVYGERVEWNVEPDSTTVRLLVHSDVRRPDTLRLAAHAEYERFVADRSLFIPVSRGSRTDTLFLVLADAAGIRPNQLTSAEVKLRLVGLDFGSWGIHWSKYGLEAGVLSPNTWEAGPWRRPRGWLYR